ncbi:MAG: hemerythrin domain-containing protein [Actinomycetota bacterium]
MSTLSKLKVDDEWRTSAAEIDEEHEKFFDLTQRLVAVVRNATDNSIILQALSTLQQRFRLHALAEEQYAGARDAEAVLILREDHRTLLEGLGELRGLVGKLSKPALVDKVEAVALSIKRHESEVDVPLFRLMTARRP